MSMRIISLQAENIKRLKAVEIKPTTAVVVIAGKNGQGKTSVLDSILWALEGAKVIQRKPIRDGEEEARVRLDLGEVIINRRFRKQEDGTTTTSLTVTDADGAKYDSPQRLLDSFMGSLTFDPLEFSRMSPKEQADALRGFVPDFDFGELERKNNADFASRTEWNKKAKEASTQAQAIKTDPLANELLIDTSKILDDLSHIGKRNEEIAATVNDIRDRKTRQAKFLTLASQEEDEIRALDAEAVKLRQRIEQIKTDIEAKNKKIAECKRRAGMIGDEIAKMPPPPAMLDTEDLRKQYDEATAKNTRIQAAKNDQQRKAGLVEKAREALEKSNALTKAIEQRNLAKRKAIENAKLPVEGLGLSDDGEVTYKGVPFNQASDAEQLRVGVGLAMAQNPTLRVIRIRDGSLLDSDAMKDLERLANEFDMQVWIERVGTSEGASSFVIEDGEVKAISN